MITLKFRFYYNFSNERYSGIANGRVLTVECYTYRNYTKILEVNLFVFAYRLFHEDFSSIVGDFCIGTHSFFQLYMYFKLIWEGFMNG